MFPKIGGKVSPPKWRVKRIMENPFFEMG